MKSPTMQHVRHIASNKRHQHKRVALMSILAALVVLGVVHALLLNGRAATKQEQVLSCPVTGTVAHHHDDNCYDAEGKLICKLPEVERHVHNDSCYREERTLVCGQAEAPAHWHDDSCYDEEGNLVCGQEETAGHTHDDSCYKVERTLVCGKEEVTEEHQHGPGCFKTVTTEVADDDPMPEQTFEHRFTDKDDKLVLKVFVNAPEGALPKGATMKAEWVPQKKLDTDLIDEAVAKKTDNKVDGYQAVDITFRDADGNEVEPAKKVTVTLTSGRIADDGTKPVLVHVESEKEAIERAEAQGKKEVEIEAQVVKPLTTKQLEKRDLADRDDQLVFDSDQFSVYAIVYTVDFKWEVNGKEYSFSLPGGGFVSFTSLSEALGIAREASGENEKDSDSEANDLQTENRASLNDIEISELTKEFVSDVEKLTFSNPELVWVGKAENDSTVGGLKEANGLECEYSAELTEEQIAEINAQTVKAGDWALISMHPFLSEESLTVTMKNGDQFVVRVTDAQDPYGLDGQNFEIIVNGNRALNPVSETETIGGVTYNFLNNAYPSSGSNLSWHFEFDQEAFDGHGGYYISHEGQYLKMVGTDENDTSRTVTLVSDKTDSTPINIVYDKAAGKYSFSNTTGSTGGYLCHFNNDYFGVAGSSDNNANAWMELRNPDNYNVPGFVSPWDVLGDNIKIKLFDYTGTVNGSDINSKWASGQGSPSAQNYRDGSGVNKGRTLLFTGSGRDDANDPYNYYTGQSPAVMQGIVSNHLGDDGYPELTGTVGTKGPSLGYLFGAGGQDGVTAYTGSGGNGLAGLLRKDENGYYYYSSEQNYATLVGNEIKIYSESYDKDNSSENARKIGFFPFDPYRKGQSKAGEEKGPNGSPYNHQFGMTMEATFVLPPDGKLPNGEDMQFNFSGDDDVWVFIDDVLVLDLGGVHQPLSGTINFAGDGYSCVTDAAVQTISGQTTVGNGKTLAELFEAAGEEYDDSSYSTHTIKFYYLERGGCDSNCTLSFNLLMYKTLTVAKELEGLTDEERAKYANNEFTCDIFVNGELYNGSDTIRYDATGNVIEEGFEIANGKVNLKPGERVRIIGLQPNDTFYAAEENGLSMTEFYPPRAERFYQDQNKASHEEEVELTEEHEDQASDISDWRTQTYPVENLEELMFTNTLREKNLDVEKTWSDGADKHSGDEVKFKVAAKVKIDGQEYDYTDVISAMYSDTTVQNQKIADVLNTTYTLSAANGWKAQLEHLPAVNNAQQEIFYEVVEIQTANGYASSITGEDSHNIDVVKIFPEGHTFEDEEIKFKLKKGTDYYNEGSKSWGPSGSATVYTLNADNNYTQRFHDFPAGDYSYEEVGNNEGNDNQQTDGLVVYDRALKKYDILNGPFNITVEKKWDPEELANEQVDGRKVEITLGRYILMDKKGNLTIRKEGVPAGADFKANYTVKNTETNEIFGIYPYVPGGITIDVPEGSYTVTEEIIQDDDTYTHEHGENTKTVEIEDSGNASAVFTSTYSPIMGQMTIKSTLEANGTGVSFDDVKYEVYDTNGNKVKEFSFSQVTGDGATFEIKTGNYVVREVNVPETPGLVAKFKPKKPDNSDREIGVAVKQDGDPAKAEFKATYQQNKATVKVTISNPGWNNPKEKISTDFNVGDTIRITYKKNNSETINVPTVTGGTLLQSSPEQDVAPGGGNGYTGTYHVDIRITDKNVTAAFSNPGIGNGWSAMNINDTTITRVSTAGTNSTTNSTGKRMLGAPQRASSETYKNIDLPAEGTGGTVPDAPEGSKYVEDTSFTHDKITLTYGHWSDIVKDLESVDENGNPYCYYIKSVHEEKMPATTTASIKMDGENLLLVGADNASTPLTVTNDVETKGPLALKKVVKVNGADPTDDNKAYTNGTYTFRVKASGDDTTLHTVTITYTDGEVTAATLDGANVEHDNDGYVHIDKIEQGDYVITEVAPVNGTSLSALDGGTARDLAAASITVTVTAGEELADEAKACFTNNIETTQLTVNKVWTDASEVGHTNDTINYKLYRIPYVVGDNDQVTEYETEEVASAEGYNKTLTANSSPVAWTNTITGLPTSGSYTPEGGEAISVMYEYYVSEEVFPGYKPGVSGGWNSETRTYSFTFKNEPRNSFDKPTEVMIEKEWKNAAEEDDQAAHNNDVITFSLIQTQYEAEIYPLKINLINGDGTTSDLSRTIYVPKDCQINLRPESQSNGNAHRVNVSGTNKDGAYIPNKTVFVNNANGGREVTFTLQKDGDTWSNEISGTQWRFIIYDNSHSGSVTQNDNIISEEDLMSWILEHRTPVETSHEPFEYTMQLNEAKNGTSIINGEHAIGEGTGDPAAKWKGKVTDLPLYEKGEDGKFYGYTYAVTEVKIGSETVTTTSESGFNGETSKYFVKWTGSDDSWTITNQKKPDIDITVKKLNKNELSDPNAELLPGATFILTKYKDASYQETDNTWPAQTLEDTESSGTFAFTGLTEGYYMLDESVAPAGYIKTDKNPKFKVEDQKVILLNEDGGAVTTGNDGTVRVENSSESTVFVGNEPGAELPAAGGIGNALTNILGAMAISAVVFTNLLQRRREFGFATASSSAGQRTRSRRRPHRREARR